MFILGGQVIDQPQKAAPGRLAQLQAEADQKQDHDHHGHQQHHAGLHPVGDDVGVRPAQHDVNQQHGGGDDQRPHRRHAQQNLEHDQPGYELAGQVETQQQREQRHQHPNALGLVAVAQILRDGTVAETMAGLW